MKYHILNNMRECLVLCRDPRPGDSLMHLPAICALAGEFERVNVIMANREIQDLADFPKNVCDGMRDEPRGHRIMPVFLQGVSEAIGFKIGPDMPHPTVALCRWAGFECDDIPKQPKIKIVDEDVPAYDVLLAPWSSDFQRGMLPAQARALVHAMGPGNYGVVGGREDNDVFHLGTTARVEYGHSFNQVANLMLKARVVVTMDSFAGRFAHAVGVKNHLLLLSQAMPYQWATHPGATIVPVKLNESFDPGPVAHAIEKVLGVVGVRS